MMKHIERLAFGLITLLVFSAVFGIILGIAAGNLLVKIICGIILLYLIGFATLDGGR